MRESCRLELALERSGSSVSGRRGNKKRARLNQRRGRIMMCAHALSLSLSPALRELSIRERGTFKLETAARESASEKKEETGERLSEREKNLKSITEQLHFHVSISLFFQISSPLARSPPPPYNRLYVDDNGATVACRLAQEGATEIIIIQIKKIGKAQAPGAALGENQYRQ